MDICVGVLLFFFVGFGLMYPDLYYGEASTRSNGYFGFGGVWTRQGYDPRCRYGLTSPRG